jgi:putative flavoprotein involved in K+ transport
MVPLAENVDSIVIGAGPAGLAAARELIRAGRRVIVFEKGPGVATSWRSHREGLRLHTVRRLSGLPGMRIPRSYGQYVSSADLVRYLERYTEHFGIEVRHGVVVSTIRRADAAALDTRWTITTTSGTVYTAATVVMATGYNRLPYVPDLPGLDDFTPPTLHVAEYTGGDQFAGLDVLVVGAGNAAAEAATELASAGARRIRMAVRTTPHIVRRRVGGVSMQRVAIAMGLVPRSVANAVAAALARLTVPDLSGRLLARPRADLYTRVERDQSVPVHDTGIVSLVESGAVSPVAAVVGFDAAAVRLADGSRVHPDVVVFATGYSRGLEPLLGGLGLLDQRGNPLTRSGSPAAPGFYFVGFTVSATGALREMASDARHVGKAERRRTPAAQQPRTAAAVLRLAR